MLKWTNKIDNVDDILADDINSIAQEVIRIELNANDLDTKIGGLENLETSDKSSIVNAINEIVASGSSSGIIVDQTYNSTSENAQSGKAVAEAVSKLYEFNTSLDAKITVNSQAITELQQSIGDIDIALTGKADISYVDSAISAAIGEALEGDY